MTFRQRLLKIFYPVLIGFTKLLGKNSRHLQNAGRPVPPVSFYGLQTTLNNGTVLEFASLKGKKVLLVNTASDCGYTNQYDALQQLYETSGGKLVVIGFPANDFKEQEKGSDAEIAEFCKINFGVTFPLAAKSTVVNGARQNPVFNWLSHAEQNGWCNQQPVWNFSKYLVNEAGVLTGYFDPSVSPVHSTVKKAVQE